MSSYYVKRVIGLPGDKVEIRKGVVYINDNILNEPFTKIPFNDTYPAITVPKDEYFLLGDNRPNSIDSRHWKHPAVNINSIVGKVVEVIHNEDKGKQ
jgi:signal peptidase I